MESMPYELILSDTFETWLDQQEEDLRLKVMASLDLLEERGPLLARPYADSLYDSKMSNLKELRVKFKGAPIRVLFAFDPKQQAVILLAGTKQGDKRWYTTNIPIAEKLFSDHVERQRKADEEARRKELEK